MTHNTHGPIEVTLEEEMAAFDRLPRSVRDAINYAGRSVAAKQVQDKLMPYFPGELVAEHVREKVGYFDPKLRRAHKAQARAADAKMLASGSADREQMYRANSFFASLRPGRAKIGQQRPLPVETGGRR